MDVAYRLAWASRPLLALKTVASAYTDITAVVSYWLEYYTLLVKEKAAFLCQKENHRALVLKL